MTASVRCPRCDGKGVRRLQGNDGRWSDVTCHVCSGSGAASWGASRAPAAPPARAEGPEGSSPPALPQTPERTRRRNDDPATSHAGARDVALRANTHKAVLLRAYLEAGDGGLTDEQAGERSGLAARRGCCYWKRCGELRADGLIVVTETTRTSSAGSEQRVSVVTDAGRSALAAVG